jgi:hypothetical protein
LTVKTFCGSLSPKERQLSESSRVGVRALLTSTCKILVNVVQLKILS